MVIGGLPFWVAALGPSYSQVVCQNTSSSFMWVSIKSVRITLITAWGRKLGSTRGKTEERPVDHITISIIAE